MVLECKVIVSVSLIHKHTLNTLDIDKEFGFCYDEDSEEYMELYKSHESILDMVREGNEEEFDKKLLVYLNLKYKEEAKKTITQLADVFRKCCEEKYVGWFELAGYIINARDFCAINIKDLSVKISKH